MQEKFKDFQILHGREEKVNPKLTTYQVELAQVEACLLYTSGKLFCKVPVILL